MSVLIKNGIVVDPAAKTETKADVLIREGRIEKIGPKLRNRADEVIDADGCYIMPGFIDMHVHLRDPGLEYKESIETGGAAALHGGFTTIVAMPNTKPVADRPDVITFVKNKAEALTRCSVIQAGSLTAGQKGKELSDLEGMLAVGCRAFSEDGKSVMNSKLARDAMRILASAGAIVMSHCEDIDLVDGGVMNEDENCKRLGFRGISNSVEDIITARNIFLARDTGIHLHLCHCSTAYSVEMVRLAKEAGISVSAEVCPHHFTLTSDDIPGDDANYKMNPPLRTPADRDALIEGLRSGIMEVISTDHAPHSEDEKRRSFTEAPFGIVGLETAAALTYTQLVKPGILTVMQMAERMSYNPAKILGIDRGSVAAGEIADLVIFDPEASWTVDPAKFRTKGKNTPFTGRKLDGVVRATIVNGEIAYQAD